MKELSTITKQTMSSLEIAKLVESRHDKVKQSIERLTEKGIFQLPPLGSVKNNQGQTVKYYELSKRDSYVVVAQLSPEFTGRLVDRWQELEGQATPSLPQTYIAALEALLESEKEKQAALQVVEKQQVSIAYKDDLIVASNEASIKAGEVMVREFVKSNDIIDIGEKLFYKWMRDQNIIMKNNEPYQTYRQRGYFHWRPSIEGYVGKIRHQLFITPRGKIWLAAKYMNYLDSDIAA